MAPSRRVTQTLLKNTTTSISVVPSGLAPEELKPQRNLTIQDRRVLSGCNFSSSFVPITSFICGSPQKRRFLPSQRVLTSPPSSKLSFNSSSRIVFVFLTTRILWPTQLTLQSHIPSSCSWFLCFVIAAISFQRCSPHLFPKSHSNSVHTSLA